MSVRKDTLARLLTLSPVRSRSIEYGKSHMTLSMMGGEKSFTLRPENRMFRHITVGTRVTIEVNDRGEVIDIHKDKNKGVSKFST